VPAWSRAARGFPVPGLEGRPLFKTVASGRGVYTISPRGGVEFSGARQSRPRAQESLPQTGLQGLVSQPILPGLRARGRSELIERAGAENDPSGSCQRAKAGGHRDRLATRLRGPSGLSLSRAERIALGQSLGASSRSCGPQALSPLPTPRVGSLSRSPEGQVSLGRLGSIHWTNPWRLGAFLSGTSSGIQYAHRR
jgi:hypothetical protein